MASRKMLRENGNTATFEVEISYEADGKKLTAKNTDANVGIVFSAPKSATVLKAWVSSLSDKPAKEGDDSPVQVAYDNLLYAMDLKCRAAVRSKLGLGAAESTVVKRDENSFDLFSGEVKDKAGKVLRTLGVPQLVNIINTAIADAANYGSDPQVAVVNARRKLLEGGKVKDSGGRLVTA